MKFLLKLKNPLKIIFPHAIEKITQEEKFTFTNFQIHSSNYNKFPQLSTKFKLLCSFLLIHLFPNVSCKVKIRKETV